jgi:hypothetical protein
VIGECENREGLGLAAAAGDLHRPFVGLVKVDMITAKML